MNNQKERNVAIPLQPKESVQDRLKALFKGRTLRKVAQEWGLPYSTLNNYFTKGAKPGLDVVEKISEVENVSIEWLVTGRVSEGDATMTRTDLQHENLKTAWNLAFEYMDKSEAESLLRIVLSGGARGVIKMASVEKSLESEFNNLPVDMKERAIDLVSAHIEAKKGASEGSEVTERIHPQAKEKQAS